jgi:RND superfamily putative drug exporter
VIWHTAPLSPVRPVMTADCGPACRSFTARPSAAAIMICVFAAFVLGDLRVLRVIGLGMAVAVLLDATLVRMVATPAILQLTGRSNWWFPRWLDRVMPSFLTEVLASTKGTS